MDYDAVLFDNDGVLVTPPAHETQAEAARAAFDEVGVADPDQRHVDDVVGGVTVERLREICAAYDVDPEAFWAAREYHDEQSQFVEFRAGNRERYDDVSAIDGLAQRRGVVSNNHHSTVEFVLDFFELRPLFETVYGREKRVDSLRLKKPNPHYLERALADLSAESALYVGDSESDVVAARRAGVDSAFVRRPHCRDADLSVEPTYDVASLHDVADVVAERTDA